MKRCKEITPQSCLLTSTLLLGTHTAPQTNNKTVTVIIKIIKVLERSFCLPLGKYKLRQGTSANGQIQENQWFPWNTWKDAYYTHCPQLRVVLKSECSLDTNAEKSNGEPVFVSLAEGIMLVLLSFWLSNLFLSSHRNLLYQFF